MSAPTASPDDILVTQVSLFAALLQRRSGLLFVPGWPMMIDFACHSWCRPFAAVTGALVRPFVFLDRHVPAVRRHGYLLATVVTLPDRPG